MRRQFQYFAAAALAAVAALPAAAKECQAPGPAPTIPDGTTATADQMKSARDSVQSYVNVLQDYQDCLESSIKHAPKETKQEDLQRLRDKGNAAIDQAEALKNNYIAQVRLFKARQPPTK
jgi:hypothetical protein